MGNVVSGPSYIKRASIVHLDPLNPLGLHSLPLPLVAALTVSFIAPLTVHVFHLTHLASQQSLSYISPSVLTSLAHLSTVTLCVKPLPTTLNTTNTMFKFLTAATFALSAVSSVFGAAIPANRRDEASYDQAYLEVGRRRAVTCRKRR